MQGLCGPAPQTVSEPVAGDTSQHVLGACDLGSGAGEMSQSDDGVDETSQQPTSTEESGKPLHPYTVA